MSIRVGYNRRLALALLFGAAAVAGLGFATKVLVPAALVVGAVVAAVAGVLMLARTYFEVLESEIRVHALLGPFKRRFAFESRDRVQLERGRLVVATRTGTVVVPVSRAQADGDDWARLVAALAAHARDA